MSQEVAPPHCAAQVLVDRDGAVRLWSKGCERLFGYAASEVVGKPVDFIIVPKYRDGHWRGFRAAMERTDPDRAQSVGNIPVLHADGAVQPHPFRQIQLCDAFGRSTGAIVIFSDPLPPGKTNGLRNVFTDALEPASPAVA